MPTPDLPASSTDTTANGLPYPTDDTLLALLGQYMHALAAELPQVASGTVGSAATTADGIGTTHVTFPAKPDGSPRFTAPPIVTATCAQAYSLASTGNQGVAWYITNVTAAGFDFNVRRANAGLPAGFPWYWIAVQDGTG